LSDDDPLEEPLSPDVADPAFSAFSALSEEALSDEAAPVLPEEGAAERLSLR
jgi:hypothetical protein